MAQTLAANQLHKLELETENVSITMRAKAQRPVAVPDATFTEAEAEEMEESQVSLVRSKDVGLFKAASDLEAGAPVSKGQKIGVVESVSVEHDLVSDQEGTIVELLVADGDPVEYGQPILVLSESEG